MLFTGHSSLVTVLWAGALHPEAVRRTLSVGRGVKATFAPAALAPNYCQRRFLEVQRPATRGVTSHYEKTASIHSTVSQGRRYKHGRHQREKHCNLLCSRRQRRALKVSAALRDLLGESTWLRDFNLDSGELLAEALDVAISEAKWFILLLSQSATRNNWVILEANRATFKAIEDQDFRIIVLRMDDAKLPKHLHLALRGRETVDLRTATDWDTGILWLAQTIEQAGPTKSRRDVYVDRGKDADRFTLAMRRNPIIFILGWPGIGKTAFVMQSAA